MCPPPCTECLAGVPRHGLGYESEHRGWCRFSRWHLTVFFHEGRFHRYSNDGELEPI